MNQTRRARSEAADLPICRKEVPVPVSSLRRFAFAVALLAAAGFAHATPDLAAPDAAAAVAAGKITLIDIRTPPEWKETGVARGAKLVNMLHPQGAPGFADALLEQVKGDRNAPIALICRTGNRTTQVQRYLQSQGLHAGLQRQGRHGRQHRRPGLAQARPAGGDLQHAVLTPPAKVGAGATAV
jgi:rhodanese-related sulfurtransferase